MSRSHCRCRYYYDGHYSLPSSAPPDRTCEIPCSPRTGRCWDPPTGGKSSSRVGRAEASEMPDHRSKFFSPHQALCGSHWPARIVTHEEQRGRACPSSNNTLSLSLSLFYLHPSSSFLSIPRHQSVPSNYPFHQCFAVKRVIKCVPLGDYLWVGGLIFFFPAFLFFFSQNVV